MSPGSKIERRNLPQYETGNIIPFSELEAEFNPRLIVDKLQSHVSQEIAYYSTYIETLKEYNIQIDNQIRIKTQELNYAKSVLENKENKRYAGYVIAEANFKIIRLPEEIGYLKNQKREINKSIIADVEAHKSYLKILQTVNNKISLYTDNLQNLLKEINNPQSVLYKQPITSKQKELIELRIKTGVGIFWESLKPWLITYYGTMFTPNPSLNRNLKLGPIQSKDKMDSSMVEYSNEGRGINFGILDSGGNRVQENFETNILIREREKSDIQGAEARIRFRTKPKGAAKGQDLNIRLDYKLDKRTYATEIVMDVTFPDLNLILGPDYQLTQSQREQISQILYKGLGGGRDGYHTDIATDVPQETWTYICEIAARNCKR